MLLESLFYICGIPLNDSAVGHIVQGLRCEGAAQPAANNDDLGARHGDGGGLACLVLGRKVFRICIVAHCLMCLLFSKLSAGV